MKFNYFGTKLTCSIVEDPRLQLAASYLAAGAHGVIYIAALSFLNIRFSSHFRGSRIALGHFVYLLGCAATGQITSKLHWEQNFGIALSFSTGISLIMLSTNELLQYFKVHDYKSSLDPTVDAVNKQGLLLLDRKEIVDTLRSNSAHFPEGFTMIVTQVKRRWKLTPLLLLLKVQGFMLLESPMEWTIQEFMQPQFKWVFHWIPTGCVILFVLLSVFISPRKTYLAFTVMQIVCLASAMIVITASFTDFVIPALIYYAMLSVCYPVADISLMDTSDPGLTELYIAIGFGIEKLLIALFTFTVSYNHSLVFAAEIEHSFLAYSASFLIYTILMIILVYFVYSNTHDKSLCTIRKEMLGIHMIKRSEQQPITVLPPINYAYNSRTGTYDFPADKQKDLTNRSTLNSQAIGGPSTSSDRLSTGPVFVGGMNNRYDADFQRMTQAFVLPRAIIGGALINAFRM